MATAKNPLPLGPLVPDPVIEAYKRDVDRTLLRENLKLTVEERFRRFEAFMVGLQELRRAGRDMQASGRRSAADG
ncbi:MAG: hypothetical protein IT424_08605 [Pirellulales bacterium]|nr:hypothetical protein [Pirellulales bacterium]